MTMTFPDCLIVLDTLGVQSTAAILGITVCRFDLDDPQRGADFHLIPVDIDSNNRAGRGYDAGALRYWVERGDMADVFARPGSELVGALQELAELYAGTEHLWVNGSGFETAILAHAYEHANITPPWPYWAVRDGRTLVDVASWLKGGQADPPPIGASSGETAKMRLRVLQDAYSFLKNRVARRASA